MKVSKNSKYQTREKPKRRNWRAKRGIFSHFLTSFVAKHQKIERDPLGNFFEKSLTMPKKTERGDSLVSPGMVCYTEKEEKPFWFSSLGQMTQFGTIKICRTFVELFWSVRVDRKQAGTAQVGAISKAQK